MPTDSTDYLRPQVGDLVMWFLSGPVMLVTDLHDAPHPSLVHVDCKWFTHDGHFCAGRFQVTQLVAAARPAPVLRPPVPG